MINGCLLLLLMVFFVGSTHANERAGIAKCAQLKTISERVVCYDNLAMSLGLHKTQSSNTHVKDRWIVRSEKSPINDSTNVYLSLYADKEVQTGHKTVMPELNIRCKENKTETYIIWDLYLGINKADVLIRLDKEKATIKPWTISTSNTTAFLPGNNIAFLKQLMKHNALLAQVTPYGENTVMAIFDIRGLSEAITPLREACKW